nr:glutathione S-transferase N-terminal domain-containing protein [Bradyrhizobium sp. ARR65]
MILYYAPGGCSLADHIALIETGLPYKLVRVDPNKPTEDGRDFTTISPKGYLPALELDDGTILTENLAILAYIAYQAGALLPEDGIDRWRALEATSFMTTEFHGNFRPILVGDRITIADPYLVVMLMWAGKNEIEVPERLTGYLAQMKKMPSVARALADEGLSLTPRQWFTDQK